MEQLLKSIPASIYVADYEEHVFLTLTTCKDGSSWMAGYVSERGELFGQFYHESPDPLKALQGMHRKIITHNRESLLSDLTSNLLT